MIAGTRWSVVLLAAVAIIAVLTYGYLAAGLLIGTFLAIMVDVTGRIFPEGFANLVCVSTLCGVPLAIVSIASLARGTKYGFSMSVASVIALGIVLAAYVGWMRAQMPFIAHPSSPWVTPIALTVIVVLAILIAMFIENRTRPTD